MNNIVINIIFILLPFIVGGVIKIFYGESFFISRYRVSRELNELNNLSIKIQGNDNKFSRSIFQGKLDMELQNLFYKDLSLTVNNDDKLDLILEMLKRIPPSKIKKISKLSAIFFKKNRVIISRNLLLKNSKRARKLNIRYWLLCILFMVIGVSLIILLKDVFRGDIPIGAVAYIVYIFCIGFLFEIIALQRAECILKMDEYKCIFKSFYDSETVKIVKEKI